MLSGIASRYPAAQHRSAGATNEDPRAHQDTSNHLKRTLFLSAYAAISADPVSRAYYDRKRTDGKPHNAVLFCLTRRPCDVRYATIETRSSCRVRLPAVA